MLRCTGLSLASVVILNPFSYEKPKQNSPRFCGIQLCTEVRGCDIVDVLDGKVDQDIDHSRYKCLSLTPLSLSLT